MTNHPIAEQDSLEGLLDELRWLKRVTEDDDTNVYGRTIEALSRLTRDVEEAKEALAPFAAIARDACFADHEDSYAPRPSRGRPNLADYRKADATLTRLSRPTELDADPAFVASQSSQQVEDK